MIVAAGVFFAGASAASAQVTGPYLYGTYQAPYTYPNFTAPLPTYAEQAQAEYYAQSVQYGQPWQNPWATDQNPSDYQQNQYQATQYQTVSVAPVQNSYYPQTTNASSWQHGQQSVGNNYYYYGTGYSVSNNYYVAPVSQRQPLYGYDASNGSYSNYPNNAARGYTTSYQY